MAVVHDPPDGAATRLATMVEYADSLPSKLRGLMFRRSIPDDYALVFRFDAVARRSVHMLFVPFPIDVVWLSDGIVERVETLPAWRGLAVERADTLVELPAGAAASVAVDDRLAIED
jgi:uncharacterized membrane protein (UPF0127 family)